MINDKYRYLNIGCGNRFHPEWINIDIVSHSKHVMEYDVTKGLPFSSATFDAVYHSHVIEHIPLDKVQSFINDCHRVLKPGGTLRIAFPDLESIAILYIQSLNKVAEHPTAENDSRYHWIKLELLDQMVRNVSGGQMKEYLIETKSVKDLEFIKERTGAESAHILETISQQKKSLKDKIQKFSKLSIKSKFRFIKNLFFDKFFTRIFLWGNARISYDIGTFRTSGEVHQWMYDRYSIKSLLEKSKFKEVRIVDAFTSNITEWGKFELDGKDGSVFKPDSLFVEAIK